MGGNSKLSIPTISALASTPMISIDFDMEIYTNHIWKSEIATKIRDSEFECWQQKYKSYVNNLFKQITLDWILLIF